MEFSIGIHYLHSAFSHWSDSKNVNMPSERNYFSKLETDISLEMLASHKNSLERKRFDL